MMAARDVLPLDIPASLQDWVIDNIQLGRQIGRGANGRILGARWEGTDVAVKEIHTIFMNEVSEEEFQALRQRFLRECEQSSRLRHPKIVRFFGIYISPGARVPSLVMERLHCSLTNLLEQTPVIPTETKLKILYDVSLGVRYLHSRTLPIIHRDLSSNNVLLSERMEAKVGDLGTARLVDPIKQSKMTTAPGTIHFMPPEALADTPENVQYGKELDVFSFGCVMLHTLSHQWPTPLEPVVTDPTTFEVKGRTEVERRSQYFSRMDRSKLGVLVSLIESCLSNLPKNRTSIVTLCEQLEGLVNKEHLLDLPQLQSLQTIGVEIKSKGDRLSQHQGTQNQPKDEVDFDENTKVDGLVSNLQSLSPYQSPAQLQTLASDISGTEMGQDLLKQLTVAKVPPSSMESITPMMNPTMPKQVRTSTGNNLKFTWQKCADLPIKALALSVAELDGKLYAAVDDSKNTPLVYDLHKDCWSVLPKLPYLRFSLVAVPNRKQLLAIGGSVVDGKATNKVFLWNEKYEKWFNRYPDMPTARCLASCISHGSSVIVAGGATSWDPKSAIRSVEVLHIADNHSHWSVVKHLPNAIVGAVPVIVNDNLYIAAGYNKHKQSTHSIVTVSLPLLLQSSNKSSSGRVWNKLSDMPYSSQSINHHQGHLIIFSGDYMDKQTKKWTLSPMIYIYNTYTKSWEYVAENSIEYHFDLSIYVNDSQIFLVGGLTGTHNSDIDDDLVTTCMLVTITPQ